jgi:glycerophosphoryl diester phosphodiesterase
VIAVALFVAVGGFCPVSATEPLQPQSTMAKSLKASGRDAVMIIAHRGGCPDYPESSLRAYRQAIRRGSIFLEADIQMSSDGVLYVSHDNNLKRTAGKNVTISKTNSKRLDKIRLKNGGRLLRLLKLFKEFGKDAFYIIETKVVKDDSGARRMDNKLVRLIKKCHLEKNVLVQSQSLKSLRTIHESLKSMPYMFISDKVSKRGIKRKIKQLPGFIDTISITEKKMAKGVLKLAHRRGMKVALYTARNPAGMKRFMKCHPDIIFSDDVKMSIRYLKKH